MSTQPFHEDLVIRSIKMLDIGYSVAMYFIFAIFTVVGIHKTLGPLDVDMYETRPTILIVVDIIIHVWVIGILAYIARNILTSIPWAFDGVYGYSHLKVKEVVNSATYVAFVVIFDKRLQSQVLILKKRLGLV